MAMIVSWKSVMRVAVPQSLRCIPRSEIYVVFSLRNRPLCPPLPFALSLCHSVCLSISFSICLSVSLFLCVYMLFCLSHFVFPPPLCQTRAIHSFFYCPPYWRLDEGIAYALNSNSEINPFMTSAINPASAITVRTILFPRKKCIHSFVEPVHSLLPYQG